MFTRVWLVLFWAFSLLLNCGLACAQSQPPRRMPDFSSSSSIEEEAGGFAESPFSDSQEGFLLEMPDDELTIFRLGDHFEESTTLELVQYPFEFSAADEIIPEEPELLPPSGTIAFLKHQLACLPQDQKGLKFGDTTVLATVLPDVGDDGFGISTFNAKTSLFFGQMPLFRVGPRFGWHQLSGPQNFYAPSHLFDVGADFSLMLPLSSKWRLMTTVGPSLFTDGQNLTSKALRITAMAMGFYKWSDTTTLAVGVVYLDRQDIPLLPGAGVMYQPNDRWKFDIFFPRPKISYRLTWREDREHWAYLAGELGGGTWAVERTNGAEDLLSYRDFRLVTGVEQSGKQSLRWLVEGAYVFGRELEYESPGSSFKPSSTGMIRAGVTF